jgi:hypothetical protein
MKLSANYYNYGTKVLIRTEEFKTVEELFNQIYRYDRGRTTEIFYLINNELFLHRQPNELCPEANLDVVQKYTVLENYILKAYSTEQNRERIKLVLNLKERLVDYCQTNLPKVTEQVCFETLLRVNTLDFGYESYSDYTEALDMSTAYSFKISNLDHGKLVTYLIPEEKGIAGARINFRPVDDLVSYSVWLSSPEPQEVDSMILRSYSKIPKEITDQWPQL